LRRDPCPHFNVEHCERQRARSQELVMECADIETSAERFFGFSP
jgi:hypothetical protein